MAVGVFDPGVPTHVGGRHMPGPTSPDRDSSREIDKAPGIMLLTHPAAPPRQCSAASRRAPPGKAIHGKEKSIDIDSWTRRFFDSSILGESSRPGALSERNAGGATGIEHLGHLLDALGGGIECRRDRRLGGLGPLGGGRARILQARMILFEAP
jgi:hypothetical protein